ncbi:MFS transporter [Levilactobacillus bambusae]|uniref:Major facilitator superfamily (MFS) profile domain-containing protein n=1 Tax=Levilactobacillus bambusae TaxID=2024736 RepID=A0A2V1MYG9_9LACO|nr:MFS transporter [Levilactobacillus bambusae]PWF99812.1 hypothetical protein DCM90_07060 [Levilactobacillus bambusae]
MDKAKTSSPLFKTALLSISILLMMGPVVSSTVPSMSKTLIGQSPSAVESLVSIPNFGLVFGIFIGSFLALHWGAKQTVLTGVAGVFIFGIMPVFTDSYTVLLVSRLLLGVSLGLYNSLAISLISDFYTGDELSTMMGYQSAVQSLGNSAFSFVVGYLLLFSWHAAYWIYAIALPVFFLFGAVVPMIKRPTQQTQTKTDSGQTSQTTQKVKQRVNLPVILISILTFFVFGFFMVLTVKLASLFTSENIGTASEAAGVLGGYTLLSMFVGFGYGWVHKFMGRLVLPIGIGVMALGCFGVAMFHSFWGVTLSVLVVGAGYSIANPYIFTEVNLVAPAGSKNLASSVMLVFLNVGVFVGPIWVNWVAGLFGNTTPAADMIICAVGLVILTGLIIFIQATHKQPKQA